MIPIAAWTRLGVRREDLRRYRAVDAAAWIKHPERWPEPNEVEKKARGSIVVRLEESQASYLLGGDGDALKTVVSLADRFPDRRITVLARYSEQERLFASVGRNVAVCDEPYFGVNMLKGAALFVGRGGTMNAEGALLGVPTISYFPGRPTYVDKYLQRKGALKMVADDSGLLKAAEGLLVQNGKSFKSRASALLSQMEDPAVFIAKALDREAAWPNRAPPSAY